MIKEPRLQIVYSPTGRAGEYAELAANILVGCDNNCEYCVDGNTLVTKSDLSVTPIKDIKIGDKLVGFKNGQKDSLGRSRAKFIDSIVTATSSIKKLVFEIELENGLKVKCSENHRWLTTRGWKYTTNTKDGVKQNQRPVLTLNNKIRLLGNMIQTPNETDLYMKGYLSGIIKGDGHLKIHGPYTYTRNRKDRKNNPYVEKSFYHQFNLRMNDDEPLKRTKEYLAYFNIKASSFKVNEKLNGIRTSTKKAYFEITKLIEWTNELEFARGFLAGIYDAEGGFDGVSIRIHNSDENLINNITSALDQFDFKYAIEHRDALCGFSHKMKHMMCVCLKGGIKDNIKFWQITNPSISRKRHVLNRASFYNSKVKKITNLGYVNKLYDITTTTENFIANGMMSHNCYGPKILHRTPEEFHSTVAKKKDALRALEHDAKQLNGDPREILLCFTSDIYSKGATEHAAFISKALHLLLENNLKVNILTKGGSRSLRDFSLLSGFKDQVRMGASLVFSNDEDAHKYEPGAATTTDRQRALYQYHKAGTKTWVSLEPVWDAENAIQIINNTYKFVDEYKIGKLNYHSHEKEINWPETIKEIRDHCDSLGVNYMLKKDTARLVA